MATIINVGKRSKDENAKALAWVAMARSTDKTQYGMSGILFVDHNDAVRAVATDGRRLHMATIPRDYIDQLGIVTCSHSDHTTWKCHSVIRLSATELTLGDQLAHGYPNYERVIPYYTDTADLATRAPDTAGVWILGDIACTMQDVGTMVPRLNATYVADTCTYGYAPDMVAFSRSSASSSSAEKNRPIVLSRAMDGDDRIAVIAPAARDMK